MSYSPLRTWDGTRWRPSPPPPSASTNPAAGSNSTATTLAVSPVSLSGSGTVTLTATVSGTPTGSVVFEYLSGTTWREISTDTGSPWTATKMINGATSFRARYLGNGTDQPSTSATKTVSTKTLQTFTKTYAATGTGSYSESGTKRTDSDHIFQGLVSSVWDEQRSVIVFGTQIQSDLADAHDITKVELFLNALHWGQNSGGTVCIRTINNTVVPSTWAGANDISTYDATSWSTKTGAKWCDISSIKGAASDWKAGGTKKGIALWAFSGLAEYYGYFAGNGETNEPQLRITYRKYV